MAPDEVVEDFERRLFTEGGAGGVVRTAVWLNPSRITFRRRLSLTRWMWDLPRKGEKRLLVLIHRTAIWPSE